MGKTLMNGVLFAKFANFSHAKIFPCTVISIGLKYRLSGIQNNWISVHIEM